MQTKVEETVTQVDTLIEANVVTSQQELEILLENFLLDKFQSLEEKEQKTFYHQLSIQFHPDKPRHATDIRVNLQIILNNAWRKEQACQPQTIEPYHGYNPLQYVQWVDQTQASLMALYYSIPKRILSGELKIEQLDAEIDRIATAYDDKYRKAFPKKYLWKDYSERIKIFAALCILLTIAPLTVIHELSYVILCILCALEIALLDIASAGKFAKTDSQKCILQYIYRITVEEESKESIDEIYQTYITNLDLEKNLQEQYNMNIDKLFYLLAFISKLSCSSTEHFFLLTQLWQETINSQDDTYYLQNLALLCVMPLTAIRFGWEFVHTLIHYTTILLHAAMWSLINAPLKIHAYFNEDPEPILLWEDAQPNTVGRMAL